MEERTFWELESVTYCYATLTVRIAAMHEGAPDGGIGLPLVVTDECEHIALHFDNVTEFRSCAEPCYQQEGDTTRLTRYLFECTNSKFVETVCPAGKGAKAPARHFCVFTERVVVDVLANAEPRVELLAKASNG